MRSTKELNCRKCGKCFFGVLNGVFSSDTIYDTKCSHCQSNFTFRNSSAAFVNTKLPDKYSIISKHPT